MSFERGIQALKCDELEASKIASLGRGSMRRLLK